MTLRLRPDTSCPSFMATFIAQYGEVLSLHWAEAVRREMPESHYAQLPWDELVSSAMVTNQALAHHLRAGSEACWPETGLLSPRFLLEAGFEIGEVARAAWLTQEAVSHLLLRLRRLDSTAAPIMPSGEMARLRDTLGGFLAAFAAAAQQKIVKEQEHTAILLRAAQTASSTLDLSEVLRRTASIMSAAAGTTSCWFYLVHHSDPTLGTWMAPCDAGSPAQVPDASLTRFLTALVGEQAGPALVPDIADEPGLDSEWSRSVRLRSALVVPLVSGGRSLGLAAAFSFDHHRHFTAAQVELTKGLASVVAPAIANARLHKKVERLAVMEERARLSRELHDYIAQSLGCLIMRIESVREMVSLGRVGQAEEILTEVAQITEGAYVDLREAIFCLRAAVHSGPEFLPALREYLEEYEASYGTEVSLMIQGEDTIGFPPRASAQVSRIILEALTNTRKHSGARRVCVRFERVDGDASITVEDDGHGFDASELAAAGGRKVGLQIMRERVASIGGTLDVKSQLGRGTRVTVRVPLAEE